MARSAHPRRRRLAASDTLSAGFGTDTGTPIARLWTLRLLHRGGARLLKDIGDHAALALHLGVALQPAPAPEDSDFDDPPEPELTPALVRRLLRSAEADPALKADAAMQSLSEELASTENRIGFARQAFNDQALEFNNEATQFPVLVVARLLGFAPAPMLASTRSEAERAVPQVQF